MKQGKFVFLAIITLLALVLAACGAQPSAGEPTAPATDATSADTTTEEPATDEGATEEPATDEGATEEEEAVALGGGDTKVVIWHNWQGDYYTAIEQIFADYATQNNVSIELLKVGDLNQKVQVAVPSGQGPDIVAWVNDQIGKNALSQIIQPLDEYGVDEAYLRENFTDIAASAMIYEGQVYGIPESMEALTFIYNSDLISEDEIPANTDDLIARSQEYNTEEQYLFVYNAQNDAYFSAPWWQGAGVTLVTPDGTTELNSPEGVAAAQLIQSFSQVLPTEIDYPIADALFKEGKAAMIMNGPWAVADYQAAGLNIGLKTIPIVSSSGEPAKPFVGVKMLMLTTNAKDPQAAVEVMKYYGSTEVQAQLAELNKQVPANTAAQEQVASDPIIAGFIEQAANGVPLPNTEFIDAMWEPIQKTVEAIWTGATPPEQAVQDGAALFEEQAQDLR
jgi:arabinogalactan oligomer/maltooligosaccharide transport system substrate-binding protein